MANIEVFCIVAAGGTVGGLIAWLAWSLGYMTGGKAVSDHWQDSIKTDLELEEYQEPPPTPTKEFHVAPKPSAAIFWCNGCSLNRVPEQGKLCIECLNTPGKKNQCNCGGLCPSCALERGISEAYGVK